MQLSHVDNCGEGASFQYSDHSELACCCWWRPSGIHKADQNQSKHSMLSREFAKDSKALSYSLISASPSKLLLGQWVTEKWFWHCFLSRSQWRVWAQVFPGLPFPALPPDQSVGQAYHLLSHAATFFMWNQHALFEIISDHICSSCLKSPMTLYCCKNEVCMMHSLAITSEPVSLCSVSLFLFNLSPLLSILSQEEICT